jgi:hypothetical protein
MYCDIHGYYPYNTGIPHGQLMSGCPYSLAVEFTIRALSPNCPSLHRVRIEVRKEEYFGDQIDAAAKEWAIDESEASRREFAELYQQRNQFIPYRISV